MKHFVIGCAAILWTLTVGITADAQALDRSTKQTVTIAGGVSVDVYARAGSETDYYYIPSRVRIAGGSNNEPQLTILTYVSDGSEGASGGTFNALVTWGLTRQEERSVQRRLARMKPGARLRGAATLDTVEEGPAVSVLVGLGGAEEVAWSGVAPLQAGGRAAIAANLSPRGAALLDVGVAKANVSGISVSMNFLVPFKADLGNCRVSIDWDSFSSEFEQVDYDDVKRDNKWFNFFKSSSRTQTLVNSASSYMVENGFASSTCDYDRATPEQIEFFENAVAAFIATKIGSSEEARDAAELAALPTESDDEEDGPAANEPDRDSGYDRYYFDYVKYLTSFKTGSDVFEIDRSITVRLPIGVTGNVNEWVPDLNAAPDGVRVKSVNLSTTEFNQVPINFSLGARALEMFGLREGSSPQLNTVVVTARKQREDGADFLQSHPFTKRSIEDGAFDVTMEYARGASTDPLEYEYAVTWNYVGKRGREGRFVTSSAGSHTLEPDAQSAPVMFRADPFELEDSGIMGATAQIKYRFLGEDRTANLNVFAGEDPQDQDVVFVDSDRPNIAVRTVFTHREHGELATDWEAKSVPNSGSVVVFAIIPDELRNGEPTFIDRARDAVETAAARELDDVLEEFNKL
ncbi:MAG: hypothetical protein AAF582_03205 [Pseudomonadota bacterium]